MSYDELIELLGEWLSAREDASRALRRYTAAMGEADVETRRRVGEAARELAKPVLDDEHDTHLRVRGIIT